MKKYVERLAFRSDTIVDDWGTIIKKKISFVTSGKDVGVWECENVGVFVYS
jgi:hypothetical protein